MAGSFNSKKYFLIGFLICAFILFEWVMVFVFR